MTKNRANKVPLPTPLFDTISNIKQSKLPLHINLNFASNDFQAAMTFLKEYDGNLATFNSYRREVERLLQWSWLIVKSSIFALKREDIEAYLAFCQKPPMTWIGVAKVPRFIPKDEMRIQNPAWRPFVATVSKAAMKKGSLPNINQHKLSEKALREIFAVLSSFYNFMIQEKFTEVNPLLQIRQKNKYFRKRQRGMIVRRLTELQWDTVIDTAHQLMKSIEEET